MHPNPAFRGTGRDENLAFSAARGFGMLCINGAAGPIAAHVPFVILPDGAVEVHLARSNDIARADLPAPALLAVQGPDAYISPDWYGVPDQVPTWNYVAVHLRGVLHPLPDDGLEPQVDALTEEFEGRLAGKRPWTKAKMGEGVMARMMRGILPFRLEVTSVDGTWKLNQNKTPEARAGVIAALEAQGGMAGEIAALMRRLG
ncbi:MAG: negative transcriptional regulator [Rhodobacter sp.]|nr:negative transcriptional regulator [Rhodobacter sp.]